MDIKQIKYLIANTAPFDKLKEAQIEDFFDICEIKEYKNRETIYTEGGLPDFFYVLLRGRLVASTAEHGKETEIELLKRGTCFGIISFFNDEPHSVTVRSIESAVVLRIEKEIFKDFITRHPVLSFDFSRMLSQRVRSRFHPKKIFQCKRIGVIGCLGAGKTRYLFNLGVQLAAQTGKKVICVEIASAGKFTLLTQGSSELILALSQFYEEGVSAFIQRQQVDCLVVDADVEANLPPLLNYLSENYHFIVFEIALPYPGKHVEDFIADADFLHVVVQDNRDDMKKTAVFLQQLRVSSPINYEKTRLVVHGFSGEGGIAHEEIRAFFDMPVYAAVPHFREDEYFKTLRRIARELGEVVVGVALGSGGSFGFAHVGVLKVLEENAIDIDIISGTSIGALFAAMWAVGMDAAEIEKAALEVSKKMDLFSFRGFNFPFRGFIQARRIEALFRTIFKDMTFADIKRPVKIVAFDFLKRETKVLTEGYLYKAVAASCAIPGVFEPISVKGDVLLDGGILSPLPTKILLNAGARRVIAVNISPSQKQVERAYKKRKHLHIFDFIFGSVETMQKQFVEEAVKLADVVIEPDLEDMEWFEFSKAAICIERGQDAARAQIGDIQKLVRA